MLSETQTPATLHQQLPNHTVHTIPASTVGRHGEGLLLAVRQLLPFSITHWDADQTNCVIWLTLRPSHTSQTIGVCCVPPETTITAQTGGKSAQLRFQALTDRLLVANAQGHAMLAGDFNARVGSLPDPWMKAVGDSIPPLQFTLKTAAVHWCLVTASLYEEWIFIGEMQWHKAAVSSFGTAAQKNNAGS